MNACIIYELLPEIATVAQHTSVRSQWPFRLAPAVKRHTLLQEKAKLSTVYGQGIGLLSDGLVKDNVCQEMCVSVVPSTATEAPGLILQFWSVFCLFFVRW